MPNIHKYFVFSILLLLLFNIFLIKEISENTQDLEGIIGFNKISVKSKDILTINPSYGLTGNEIFDLSHRLKNNLSVFTLPFHTNIKNNLNNIWIKALAVNSSYKYFTKIKILKGSFITKKQEENMARVLVIDKTTAYKLFKSIDIIGMNITLLEEKFKIIGVSEENKNFLAKLLSRKKPNIYIPLQTIFDLNQNPVIPYFQIAISDQNGVIQEKKDLIKILEDMDKTPSNYHIIDHRNFQKRVFQITKGLIFVIGIFITYFLIKKQLKIVNKIYWLFKNNYPNLYLRQIIKSKWKNILILVIQLFFWIYCIYLIYKYIKFDFYLSITSNNYFLYCLNFLTDIFFETGRARTILESIPCFSEFLISLILACQITFGVLLFIGLYLIKSCKIFYQPCKKYLMSRKPVQ